MKKVTKQTRENQGLSTVRFSSLRSTSIYLTCTLCEYKNAKLKGKKKKKKSFQLHVKLDFQMGWGYKFEFTVGKGCY